MFFAGEESYTKVTTLNKHESTLTMVLFCDNLKNFLELTLTKVVFLSSQLNEMYFPSSLRKLVYDVLSRSSSVAVYSALSAYILHTFFGGFYCKSLISTCNPQRMDLTM